MSKEISEIKEMLYETHKMIHKTNLLVEEQRADNRIVLESLQALWQRQDRIEGNGGRSL